MVFHFAKCSPLRYVMNFMKFNNRFVVVNFSTIIFDFKNLNLFFHNFIHIKSYSSFYCFANSGTFNQPKI